MALLRARESVMSRFRPMLREHGLTEQKWRVLRAMAASQRKLRPIELSQITCISMPSLSRLLKSLQALALVEHSANQNDLRSSDFALTAKGSGLVREVAPHSERIYAEIERMVGLEEVSAVYALCARVEACLGPAIADGDGDT